MRKTKRVMLGVTTLLGGTLAGCADEELPPKPQDPYCSKFEYDYGDEEWECDEIGSRHYGYYYIGNTAYPDTDDSKSTTKKLKKGFGSGSKATGS
ncbi:MAG: hypothetical protein ACE3JP_02245 [Ectobacillus sp.]